MYLLNESRQPTQNKTKSMSDSIWYVLYIHPSFCRKPRHILEDTDSTKGGLSKAQAEQTKCSTETKPPGHLEMPDKENTRRVFQPPTIQPYTQ